MKCRGRSRRSRGICVVTKCSEFRVRRLPLAHRANKWTRLSALSDALLKRKNIGRIPKVDSTFFSPKL